MCSVDKGASIVNNWFHPSSRITLIIGFYSRTNSRSRYLLLCRCWLSTKTWILHTLWCFCHGDSYIFIHEFGQIYGWVVKRRIICFFVSLFVDGSVLISTVLIDRTLLRYPASSFVAVAIKAKRKQPFQTASSSNKVNRQLLQHSIIIIMEQELGHAVVGLERSVELRTKELVQ